MPTQRCASGAAAVLAVCACAGSAIAQERPTAFAATRATPSELRIADQQIDQLIRSRDLRIRETVRDSMLPERVHERFDQYVHGVRIVGGDLTRQAARDGTVSLFGLLHVGVDLDVNPRLTSADARTAIRRAVSGEPRDEDPELVVLPMSDGYHLAYFGQAITDLEVIDAFVDANDGHLLRQYSEFQNEVIQGIGTYGDNKKVSVTSSAGTSIADDKLRPTEIMTYDMKGSLARTTALFGGALTPAPSDVASTSGPVWNDGTVVDAHVYAGWFYDYLFKRFGRRGIDDRNLRIALFTHPVRLADIGSAPPNVVGVYYVNAAFCSSCGPNGRGAVIFGEGAPRGFLAPNLEVKPFSAALDVVAHELTHAVTASSARLNGFPFSEAGALNEAFSDLIGVSAAFFHQPPGTTPLTASYVQGRDLTVPAGALARSMANPVQTGDPDHYTQRFVGGDPHSNGVIVTHAFYLAIEGGTNRTSGRAVQGVGAANREQIEKSFFRALTALMPSSSTFALARAATLQAARDLYGAGSAAERAIAGAWDAVGVQDRTTPTASLLPNPVNAAASSCGLSVQPNWVVGLTVSAGASNLRITQWQLDAFDSGGALLGSNVLPPAAFATSFVSCGPGSDRIVAQTDACAAICVGLNGRTSGNLQATFRATDEAGQTMTFATARVALNPPR